MFSDADEQLFPLREKVHRRKEKLIPDCARDGMDTAGSVALGSDRGTGTRRPAQSQAMSELASGGVTSRWVTIRPDKVRSAGRGFALGQATVAPSQG